MLIQCPECGGVVSDRAVACPHCGYPLRNVERKTFESGHVSDPVPVVRAPDPLPPAEAADSDTFIVPPDPEPPKKVPEFRRREPAPAPRPAAAFADDDKTVRLKPRREEEPAAPEKNPDDSILYDERFEFSKPKPKRSAAGCLVSFIKIVCWTVLTLILILAVFYFAILFNWFGANAWLRSLAEVDSGTGSHSDRSSERIMVKYYLLKTVNSIDGKVEEPAKPAPKEPEQTPLPELPQ